MLYEMCCYREYPSVAMPTLTPTNRPQTLKIVHMSADISEIKEISKLESKQISIP